MAGGGRVHRLALAGGLGSYPAGDAAVLIESAGLVAPTSLVVRASIDFRAEVYLLSPEEGGRPINARSGYRCLHVFAGYPSLSTSGEQHYPGGQLLSGDTATADIAILSQDYFQHRLYRGQTFDCYQGARIIGRGEIVQVINERLQLPADAKAARWVNLHDFPADIAAHIEQAYGSRKAVVFNQLQFMLAQVPAARHPRIVRAVLHLANGDRFALEDAIALARRDYRDVLLQAEYAFGVGGRHMRIHDFRNPLGELPTEF